VTAGIEAAATTAAASPERWGLVRAADWDANGQQANVIPYRSSRNAGRSAGAQNKHVRRVGLPDDQLILVLRGAGDMWDVAWEVVYDPRDPAEVDS